MTAASPPSPLPALGIAAVERDTGLPKDTLRVWERRYGFPAPGRDGQGERVYPHEQVLRLRVLKRLLDQGHRPGSLMRLGDDELARLLSPQAAATRSGDAAAAAEPLRAPLRALVLDHQADGLRAALSQALMARGLRGLVLDLVAPLTEEVGEAWARGDLSVAGEHLYAEVVQLVLRGALASLPGGGRPPRVLLATLPGELHGLGLLMAQALLATEGCATVSLGTQVPVPDIVQAAARQRADIVALSLSAAAHGERSLQGLQDLRAALPAGTALWAGGACAALHRRTPAGVLALRALQQVAPAVQAWRDGPGAASRPVPPRPARTTGRAGAGDVTRR